jgi:effector-binding domain-containing protein
MVGKLNEHVSSIRVKVAGPASGIYYNTPNEVDTQDLKWEVFYPVETDTPESAEDKGGFGIRRLPGITVASVVHHGPYYKAGPSYNRLEEFIKHSGYRVNGPAEEVHISVFGLPGEEQTLEIRLPVRSS